jgi:hypothetical protein
MQMAKRPKTRGLRSGNQAPVSGQYERRGPRGGRTGREVTAVKGKPLPPTGKGETFDLVDRTRHGRG